MSSLSIKDRQVRDVIVLEIDGDLRIGGSSDALRKAIHRLMMEGQKRILLNLAHVSYVDSSGLGDLIASHLTLEKNGGEIKLLRLTQRVRELMVITRLLTVFDIYEDETEALDSFKRDELVLTTQPQLTFKAKQYETHP